MRWRLIIEECGPKLTHIKGENNIVADALSRMGLTEKDFSAEAFAGNANANDFPTECPLSYEQIAHEQGRDNDLQSRFTKEPEKHKKQTFRHSDKSHELITREDKIVPQSPT